MPQVTYIAHDGARRTVDVPVGENVMRGALYNGVEGIAGECGGGLACATCHCYVEEEWIGKLDAPSDTELQMLESAVCEIRPSSRLIGPVSQKAATTVMATAAMAANPATSPPSPKARASPA